jgi:hypothetical protein
MQAANMRPALCTHTRAGLVDTFLDTHSKSPELVAAQVSVRSAPATHPTYAYIGHLVATHSCHNHHHDTAQADLGPLPDNTAASFFMAQGLKSLAGGNVHAALHRLGRCRQELLASPVSGSSSSPTPAAQSPATAATAAAAAAAAAGGQQEGQEQKLVPHHQRRASASGGGDSQGPSAAPGMERAVQLATVCGCLGDCYLRLEQPGQAEALYKESIAAVQPHAEGSVDAARALSVSLNK